MNRIRDFAKSIVKKNKVYAINFFAFDFDTIRDFRSYVSAVKTHTYYK